MSFLLSITPFVSGKILQECTLFLKRVFILMMQSHCRTLFGGSVGPHRKTMPDGAVHYHYDGIQVRKVPLPLRVPIHHQAQSQQQQPQQSSPVNRTASSPVVNNSNSTTSPTPQSQNNAAAPPGSPILTNLLHRKADTTTTPSVDPKVRILALNFYEPFSKKYLFAL